MVLEDLVEMRDRLIELGERWQKAERLADKNLLPDTPEITEELGKISVEANDIWNHLSALAPEMLEGITFLGQEVQLPIT